jgi:hypothetical protein
MTAVTIVTIFLLGKVIDAQIVRNLPSLMETESSRSRYWLFSETREWSTSYISLFKDHSSSVARQFNSVHT